MKHFIFFTLLCVSALQANEDPKSSNSGITGEVIEPNFRSGKVRSVWDKASKVSLDKVFS